jgi:hypothetical protein
VICCPERYVKFNPMSSGTYFLFCILYCTMPCISCPAYFVLCHLLLFCKIIIGRAAMVECKTTLMQWLNFCCYEWFSSWAGCDVLVPPVWWAFFIHEGSHHLCWCDLEWSELWSVGDLYDLMSAVGDVYDLMSWSAMCYGDEHDCCFILPSGLCLFL